MSSLNFIGGEKGGVGKSVTARLLAQYFIDRGQTFTGFDTDRSHTSFTRFYADYAAPVIVDSYAGLDLIANSLEAQTADGQQNSAIVDLAAQTAAPLARWIKDSDLLSLLAEMGVTVNFWHLADSGKDSTDLLNRLLDTYGQGPNYFVVKNEGRGTDFSLLEKSATLSRALELGGKLITLSELHEASMNKIDRQNASFWAAINNREGDAVLGMMERQRVKTWLRNHYAIFDTLPL
ncbi:nucleotide-binding protein [Uliginosibacterium aquaticum]|uniref:Mobilization protein n=1 Tax=Uliginosibacterium aquaticum TaxID=2731212 RepID=A0ABX2IHN5_9RHOO|nr:mobilization protein [Uliginosibacterium aquaticum]NSL53888.1 mobilization protein [Uliginosibacterium aquaticum]